MGAQAFALGNGGELNMVPTHRDEPTEETEDNETWKLVLSLNHELTRAKNDLEKALLDTHSLQALRRSVREVHTRLVAIVKGYAQYLEIDRGEEEEGGQDGA